jgi:hypothetical protein
MKAERVLTLLILHPLMGIAALFTLLLTRECFDEGERSCYCEIGRMLGWRTNCSWTLVTDNWGHRLTVADAL